MAPVVKIMSQTGFIYEKNNFTALVNMGIQQSGDYHKMMDFVKNCKLSYAMLESPTIFCEVVEEMWTTATYNSTDKTITLTIKGKEFCINSDVIKACFKIPDNTVTSPHTDNDIINMLNSMNYALSTSKLSDIRRMGLRNEWSFMCDVVTKVFLGKISNFDSVNISMLNMLYMLVTDKFYNFSDLVLFELGFKLGELNKRGKNVYYTRLFMMLANHLCEEIVIENPNNKLDCRVQERSLIADLNRANHHKDVPLFYFPVMQAPQGSVKEGKIGEGRGKHKRNPKDKDGELSGSQPSHTAVSQQTAVLKKDKSSFLDASSQNDVVIEQSSQPRAHAKRVRDTNSPQTYARKKKSKTLEDAHGTHTVQTGAKDTVTAPSQIQFDVAPITVESQPKSLVIETPQIPNSLTNSLDVDMINTSIPDSPSLTLLGKPKSSASEHHLLDDLLAHLPILSGTVVSSVPKISSISTESTLVSFPSSFISNLSMDIAHPSSNDCIPTDKLNSSYPSDSKTTHSMDITHASSISAQLQTSFISSAEDLVVVQSLLGLREKSVLSESLGCSQEKREEMSETMQSTSSGLEKESEWSPTLDGEGEGVRVGSQGKTLMQKKRENERNAGTGAIRMDVIASESMNVQDVDREGLSQHPKAVIDSTSLDAEAFTPPVPAYQLLAEKGNDNTERMLNLVHTTQSMMRAKDAITALPSTAGDVDYETGGSTDFFGDGSGDSEDEAMDIRGEVGSSSRSGMPSWVFSKHCDEHYFKTTLIQLINQTNTSLQTTTNASTKKLLQAHLASLQLQQIQGFQYARDENTMKSDIEEMKKAISHKMDYKLPEATMLDIKRQLRKNSDLATKIDALDTRMSPMEASLTAIHLHQVQQTDLLQKLAAAQTPSSNQLDDNKKGEKGPTAANIRAADKEKLSLVNWERIDEDIQKKFDLVKEPVKSAIHHSQVKQISVNEMSMNYLENGQSSCIKSPKAEIILKPRVNYSKSSLKNPLDTVYEIPKPDEKKLLSRLIAFYKEPADSASKRRIAKIFKNGKEICVVAGHPQFAQAKREEKARLKKLDIVDKELENQFPKESTPTTTQASKPSVVFEDIKVVDPYRNIHGEPIVPMDEPVEWKNIPIPDFYFPILNKPKRTK
ncbi:hypothetical protein AgCh_036413 [Apium graveolens]